MTGANKPTIAFVTDRAGGILHYVLQLWSEIQRFAHPRLVTYATGSEDPLISRWTPNTVRIIDPEREESVERVVAHLRELRVTVANVHFGGRAYRHIPYFTKLCERTSRAGIQVVATVHDVIPLSVYPYDHAALARLFAVPDGFLVGNGPQREKLYATFAVGNRPVGVARHGPYTLFDFNCYDRAGAREYLGWPQDAKLVLFFGSWRDDKGIESLFEAIPKLRARIPESSFQVVSNTRLVAHRREMLERLARRYSSPTVRITHDYVHYTLIEPLFKSADVVVLPYRNVSQSGVLNIARAFARPVVVSEPFQKTAPIDGSYGRAFPAGDADRLAEAIEELLAMSQSERDDMGQYGLQAALQEDGWERNARTFWRICRSCLNGNEAVPAPE